ncbi:hypothetical protein BAE44_0008825 [Dichanthelium oligosanthes]|uniref:TF-B3 domain-containing protein n=1 Tax=Dichanthelium oligosanthes TaxID=888268 RepID=A0A1E5VYG6_9POAL|nr:hypothetical protein BAE44_0008825 [Dichanthelium oligosanthes]
MAAAGGLGDDAGLAGLREVLAALGAMAPRLVSRRMLSTSDVDKRRKRLQIPRGRSEPGGGNGDASALSVFLTLEERFCVGEGHGIEVPVYDRFGRRFDMMLRRIQANRPGSYRFLGNGWWRFATANRLEEGMAVAKGRGRELEAEVWAFRSPELLPERRAEAADHHPDDGALGIAILIKISDKARA